MRAGMGVDRSWSEFVSEGITKNTHNCLGVTERLHARMRLDRNERPKQQLVAFE